MRVVAIDPGETTGIAVYDSEWAEQPPLWTTSVQGQMNAIEIIKRELSFDADLLVIEEFRISAGTARKSRGGSNTAIEIIGAAKWLAHCAVVPVRMQSPSSVMGFMTNDKLRRLGFYVPNDHARDAVRHLAYYLIETSIIPREALLA